MAVLALLAASQSAFLHVLLELLLPQHLQILMHVVRASAVGRPLQGCRLQPALCLTFVAPPCCIQAATRSQAMAAWPQESIAGCLVCRQQGLSRMFRRQPSHMQDAALFSCLMCHYMASQQAQGCRGLAMARITATPTRRPFVLCLKRCPLSRSPFVCEAC